MINQAEQWENIYRRGEQSAGVPWEFVFEFVDKFRCEKPKEETHILEVGCGVGNNLIALAKRGFQTDGLDISQTAINKAIKRAEDAGLEKKCSWVQQSCVSLPYINNAFDIVIDRGTLTYLTAEEQMRAINEIHRVMVSGGVFLFSPYLFFNKFDDGKRFYTLRQAASFLDGRKWTIDYINRYNVSETEGAPPVCAFFTLVARKT